ncbi:hypothetical protein K457DRAFT_137293 [Linnemannia elongata AG-77]|uniref:Uncharacterized protein n=1 Tax=Linnemannia elongata AG-77 TaxID=1314771 RepID=A0A197K166_9FUNG|nr:hypothetical protein K457DRAFT_137293 [Linnemannia elongata AG-77]
MAHFQHSLAILLLVYLCGLALPASKQLSHRSLLVVDWAFHATLSIYIQVALARRDQKWVRVLVAFVCRLNIPLGGKS